MQPQNKPTPYDPDDKSNRRDRFHRRKANGGDATDASRKPKHERYRRPHVNLDNMTEDDYDELLDLEE